MSNLSNSVPVNQRKLSSSSGNPTESPPSSRRGSKREHEEDLDDDTADEEEPKTEKRAGRRKIKIEYIDILISSNYRSSSKLHFIKERAIRKLLNSDLEGGQSPKIVTRF